MTCTDSLYISWAGGRLGIKGYLVALSKCNQLLIASLSPELFHAISYSLANSSCHSIDLLHGLKAFVRNFRECYGLVLDRSGASSGIGAGGVLVTFYVACPTCNLVLTPRRRQEGKSRTARTPDACVEHDH